MHLANASPTKPEKYFGKQRPEKFISWTRTRATTAMLECLRIRLGEIREKNHEKKIIAEDFCNRVLARFAIRICSAASCRTG